MESNGVEYWGDTREGKRLTNMDGVGSSEDGEVTLEGRRGRRCYSVDGRSWGERRDKRWKRGLTLTSFPSS